MSVIYLNGAFMAAEEAHISVMDRGFLFGDGVYEVIPVYNGHLFRLPQHLERLELSLAGIRLANPLSTAQWEELLSQLAARNGGGDLSLYLQITRGAAPKRDHAFPARVMPTVFAMATPLMPQPAQVAITGVAAITAQDMRWEYCHIKAITLLPNVLARQQAVDAGAAEALLLRNGLVTEGAASNLFIVKDNVLSTPPKSTLLLPGITRDLILELATTNDIPWREVSITEHELRQADEIWLTSSTREILPVTRLDAKTIGSGAPGLLWQRMTKHYQSYKRNFSMNELQADTALRR